MAEFIHIQDVLPEVLAGIRRRMIAARLLDAAEALTRSAARREAELRRAENRKPDLPPAGQDRSLDSRAPGVTN
ncbi:MAG: hypothetical protein JRJ59_06275 [Deltaproteobacteria bacterium]|nr:hypothetical protein [Deltaproteobacteria bacterium]